MNRRKGFTLVEVIVSIALLGLIAVGFLMAVTGYVRYISVTKTITQDIFQAQEKLELDIQTVKLNIRNGTVGGLTEQTFSVFGQSFVGYPLAQQVEQHQLNTVVGSAVPIDLPVPGIGAIESHLRRGATDLSVNHSYGKAVGSQTLTAVGSYSVAAGEPSFINKIQWYVSRDGFSIPMETLPAEIEIGSRFPRFPEDYEPIPYANSLTLSGLDQYIGHHIVFAVTPVAKSLKMGSMASSDPLFIDGPPVLTDLKLHLDASAVSRNVASWVRPDASDPTRIRYWLQEWPNLASALSSPSVPSATQTTPSLQPELADASYIEDEFPGVWGRLATSETAGSGMQIASFSPSSGTITVLLVARLDPAVLSGPILSGTNWSLGRQDAGNPLGVSLGTQRLDAATSTEGLDEKWVVYSAVISRNKLVFHIDKQEYSLVLGTAPSVSTGSISLNMSGADIAEVLVYSRDLSSSGDLESLKTWLFQKYKPEITPWSIRQLYPLSGVIEQGGSFALPATVSARLADGTKMNVPVDWNPTVANTSTAGMQTYVATAREDVTKTTILTLQVIGIDHIPAMVQTLYQHTGEVFTLPTEVPAVFSDGVTRQTAVVWDSPVVDLSTVGQTVVQGHSVVEESILAAYTVTVVHNPVTEITLSPASIQMQPGEIRTITATVLPVDASNPSLQWTSSHPAIASVVNGIVTGVAPGIAQITVASVSNPSVTATCSVMVGQHAELSNVLARHANNRNGGGAQNITLTYDPNSFTYTGTVSRGWYAIRHSTPGATVVITDAPSGFVFNSNYNYISISSGSTHTITVTVTAPNRIPTDYTFIIRRS